MYASYIDLHIEIDSEVRLRTKLYDKRHYFNFLIVNFPFTGFVTMINTKDVTSWIGTAYPPGVPEFPPGFLVGFVLLDL